jgi:hypothetical protein
LFSVGGFFRALVRRLSEFDTMRALFIVLCLLPSIANAYEVRVVFGGTSGSAGAFPSPDDAIFQVGPIGGSPFVEWTIPGITPANSGQIWSVDETNAPFDWSLLEAAAINPSGLQFTSEFTRRIETGFPSQGNPIVIRDVDHVEFELRQFFVSPVGSISSWRHVIVGEGYRIPEPTTYHLTAFMVSGLLLHRKRQQLGSSRTLSWLCL